MFEASLIIVCDARSVQFTPVGDGTYHVTMVSLPGRVMTLLLVDGRPQLRTTINGKPAYMNRVYVESKVRTRARARVCVSVCACVCVCECVCVCVCFLACMCMHVCVCMYVYSCMYVCMCMYVCVCVYVCMCMYACVCVYVCVSAQERMIGPKVLWVDIYGIDAATGAPVHERVLP